MRILSFYILAMFFFLSCAQTDEGEGDAHGGHAHGYQGPDDLRELIAKDILASNPSVQVGPIQTKTVLQKVSCTGRIDVPPTELFSVHSKTSGFIDLIKYIPGDYIKKGTLLFTILNPALIEKQRILLETKAAYELAQKDFLRKQTLQAENATTQKSFDEALAQKEILGAKYNGMKSELLLLGINLEALEMEQTFQPKHYIYADESGYVHKVQVNKGQMIHPDDRLMDLANNDHIHLELQILSKDVPFLEIGQQVEFMLPNNPHTYMAEVVKLNPIIDKETGTLNVHCHIEEDHEKDMKAGMFVNAEIEVEAVEVQGLPIQATIKEGENYFAFFVEEGKLVRHQLDNPKMQDGFVTFNNMPKGEVVIAGAYYLL